MVSFLFISCVHKYPEVFRTHWIYNSGIPTFGTRSDISMKHTLRLSLVLALVTCAFASGAWAQPIGGPPPCWPPPCIPIDGGISALIAAGVILGGKKALELRKTRDKAS